ncbi:MAG: hypothetical protein V4819_19920 [Verrucomicrobiota bacterium]
MKRHQSPPFPAEFLPSAHQRRTAPAKPRPPGYVEAEQFDLPFVAENANSIQLDPFSGDQPSKRKTGETARVLVILDSLERGNV